MRKKLRPVTFCRLTSRLNGRPLYGEGDRPLAIAPGNMFDHHSVHRTLHSPWRVEEIGLDAPQRHEQPLALRQSVIARGRFATFRASSTDAAVRLNAHVDPQASLGRISKADLLVDKAREMLNPVQNRLNFQLHGWSFGLVRSIACSKRLNKPETSFCVVGDSATLPCGSGDKALQECNLSTEPSMDCSDCIPPGSGKLPGRVLALRMPLQAMVKAKNSSFLSRPLGRHFQFLYPQILLQTPYFFFQNCHHRRRGGIAGTLVGSKYNNN